MARKRVQVAINGRPYAAWVDTRLSLLHFLRETLDLTGTKEGCAEGECGACSVILDGRLVDACLIFAVEANGREIRTVEGLRDGRGLHRLQSAFLEAGAIQCGFCIPGLLMAAAALLERNPAPTEDEIRLALAGNLCRCTGYQKIVQAVAVAARRGE
jgi:carbon-monoxide dehydrogenase small subunit